MNSSSVISHHSPPTLMHLETHGVPITRDWHGQKISGEVKYLFWVDQDHFHFLASDQTGPGLSHPDSEPGIYQAELWKYDVAEFFLLSADRSRYLEFNLAPNGAWWTSAFSAPLQAAPGEPCPVPGVTTLSEMTDRSWRAMARIPLPWLREHYDFGEKTALNATLILRSPGQIFLTAGDLGDGEPNFHQPGLFPPIKMISLA